MVARTTKTRSSGKQKTGPEEHGSCPQHVAIIMDGNGRWAQQRGLSRQAGHRAGTENIRTVIRAFAERDVKYLTLYAFSTENWKRPRSEINPLMRLLGRVLDRELASMHKNGVRLLHIGNLEPLPGDLKRRVCDAIELTKNNTGITVSVAFNYGGRAEIVEAARRAMQSGIEPDQLTEDTFADYLDTKGLPDPDLVVRTAGEMRLSNFLLWQAAYAEFYATPVYWPDFGVEEVEAVIEAYAQRGRRFGGLVNGQQNGSRNGHSPA
jgi:undecaprenyl diphosphate synthase